MTFKEMIGIFVFNSQNITIFNNLGDIVVFREDNRTTTTNVLVWMVTAINPDLNFKYIVGYKGTTKPYSSGNSSPVLEGSVSAWKRVIQRLVYNLLIYQVRVVRNWQMRDLFMPIFFLWFCKYNTQLKRINGSSTYIDYKHDPYQNNKELGTATLLYRFSLVHYINMCK